MHPASVRSSTRAAEPNRRAQWMRRPLTLVWIAALLLFGIAWLVHLRSTSNLPRIQLAGGGEFRVFRICYGTDEVHRLHGDRQLLAWAWKFLPNFVQRYFPDPYYGGTGVSPWPGKIALSIYWAWMDPATNQAELGPSGDVIMTADSGEDTNLDWPVPFDDEKSGGGFRQIFVNDLSASSRTLHFLVPVENETVEFTISNPAYEP